MPRSPAATPPRSRRGELLLLLAGVLIGGLLLEGVARWMTSGTNPKAGYAPVRGHRSREPMNAMGYRDIEHSLAKPKGVHRAVFVGDSFTYGVGVLFDDTYPKRVERAMSAERGEPWESVVLATPGIGSAQEEVLFENEGLPFSPDLVVLGYVLNDAENPDSAERRRAIEWTEQEEAKRHPPLWRLSAFLSLVADRVHATTENRDRVRNQMDLYADGGPGLTAVRTALSRIGELCRQRGIPFVVVVFPLFANPLGDDYPFASVHAKVDEIGAKAGAVTVDLLPYYRDLDWHLLVVEGARDEHPNELAHRIAAQALLARLRELLPPTTASHPG